jgi:hypothetical protein
VVFNPLTTIGFCFLCAGPPPKTKQNLQLNQSINQVTNIAPQIREKISIQGRFTFKKSMCFKEAFKLWKIIGSTDGLWQPIP